MVTAWSPSGMLRVRSSAGPWRRLWLAALLLGILFMHGVSTGSAEDHLTGGVDVPVSASAHGHMSEVGDDSHAAGTAQIEVATPGDQHGDHGASHPAEKCVSGQPQQGAGSGAPCAVPVDWAQPIRAGTAGEPDPSGVTGEIPALTGSQRSVVQQV